MEEDNKRTAVVPAELREQFVAKLTERIRAGGAKNLTCPICGGKKFTLLDGYFLPIIQNDTSRMLLSGRTIPSFVIICANCGFMSQHSLGILDLLPKKAEQASPSPQPSTSVTPVTPLQQKGGSDSGNEKQ